VKVCIDLPVRPPEIRPLLLQNLSDGLGCLATRFDLDVQVTHVSGGQKRVIIW
jgi:hypothetical protein